MLSHDWCPKFVCNWRRTYICAYIGHLVCDVGNLYSECYRCGDNDIGTPQYEDFWTMTKGHRQSINNDTVMLDKIKRRLQARKLELKENKEQGCCLDDLEEASRIESVIDELEYLLDWFKRKGKQYKNRR